LLSQKVNGLDPIGRRAFFPEIEITQNAIRLLQTAFMYNLFDHIHNLPTSRFPVKDSLPAGFSCRIFLQETESSGTAHRSHR
jgi:hypothetical protein